jgi:hypothetical protein
MDRLHVEATTVRKRSCDPNTRTLLSARIVRRKRYPTSATAGRIDTQATYFEITHPFHPKRGERWVLVMRRQNWGENRVMFYDAQSRLRSILESWTSVADEDPFARASAERL